MYSYDRRRVARRGTADFESLQEAIEAARETIGIATKYAQDREDFYRFLQLDPDLGDTKKLLSTASRIAQELPAVLEGVNQIDDTIDAYARTTRRAMPRHREEIDSSELDQKFLKELQRRAKPLITKLKLLSELANDAPTGFEIEDFYDSPRVAAINVMGAQLDEMSTNITFDESEYVSLLESIEENLVEAINRGPV